MAKIRITFAGAAGTVTGSRFLVDNGQSRVLVDCGLYQGLKKLRLRNWDPPPFEPDSIDAVLLTHAHIDHSGYLPRLIKEGFEGPVFCHHATRDLCEILLPDSGHLQEEQARYANRKGFSKHSPALPLYTEEDARKAVGQLQGVKFGEPVDVAPGISARWMTAGHILGASMIRLETRGRSLLFSGDLGQPEDEIMPTPHSPDPVDYLLVESTYGDRSQGEDRPEDELERVVKETVDRQGVLVIPAFAVGRSQDILFNLRELEEAGRIPVLPVALNSPMAVDVTDLYRRHPDALNPRSRGKVKSGQHLFSTEKVSFCRSVQDSKNLHHWRGPAVIISASGMMTGGRILHHLVNRLPDERNTILLVGYQAAGTRGRRLVEGADKLKIHGQYRPVRARIERLNCFSAHADREGILGWLDRFARPPDRTFVVHGDPGASEALTASISGRGWNARAPGYLDVEELD